MNINKQTISYILLALVFVGIISYWSYVYLDNDKSENDNTNKVSVIDRDVNYQKVVIDRLSKRQDVQGKLIYDIERVEHDPTMSIKERSEAIQKYKDMYASSTRAGATFNKYNRDIAVYGWMYVYSKSVQQPPSNVTSEKDISKWHKDDIQKVIGISLVPESPEVINDKVFLANRLKVISGYLINFKNNLNKDEIKKYQQQIKSDIAAMEKTSFSNFNVDNSKFIMAPVIYKMLGLVALNDSGALDGTAGEAIKNQYNQYKNLKTKDQSSYAWTGIYVDTYYLYYLLHPAFDVATTSREYIDEVNNVKSDLAKSSQYSAEIKSAFKTRVDYLNSVQGKWEKVKMGMLEI